MEHFRTDCPSANDYIRQQRAGVEGALVGRYSRRSRLKMDQTVERRESFRLPFISKVICYVDGIDKKYRGMLRDMSISSLFMEAEDCPELGSSCTIEITFEGEHSRLKIEHVKGSIVRCDDDGVAVRFEERLEWFALVPLYFNKLRV